VAKEIGVGVGNMHYFTSNMHYYEKFSDRISRIASNSFLNVYNDDCKSLHHFTFINENHTYQSLRNDCGTLMDWLEYFHDCSTAQRLAAFQLFIEEQMEYENDTNFQDAIVLLMLYLAGEMRNHITSPKSEDLPFMSIYDDFKRMVVNMQHTDLRLSCLWWLEKNDGKKLKVEEAFKRW
jgi:hypothetical protein